ncbi:MAG: hypothetical protein ACR2K6_01510 [Solirubrobacterales bacterium]
MSGSQKPLELILARNFLTSVSTPAFLVAREGDLLFYNEAAGALLGIPFEETGKQDPGEWTKNFGPFDGDGEPLEIDQLSLTAALRDGRPAHDEFCIRSVDGSRHEIAASAMPVISTEHGNSGALIVFWPRDADQAREVVSAQRRSRK